MNRNQVHQISEATMRILREHQDSEPALKGLTIRDGKGSFSTQSFTMKVEWGEPLTKSGETAISNQTNNAISMGLAFREELRSLGVLGGSG